MEECAFREHYRRPFRNVGIFLVREACDTRHIFVEQAACRFPCHHYHALAEQRGNSRRLWIGMYLTGRTLHWLLEVFGLAGGFSLDDARFVLVPSAPKG